MKTAMKWLPATGEKYQNLRLSGIAYPKSMNTLPNTVFEIQLILDGDDRGKLRKMVSDSFERI